jgi:protein-disulfide isomerase
MGSLWATAAIHVIGKGMKFCAAVGFVLLSLVACHATVAGQAASPSSSNTTPASSTSPGARVGATPAVSFSSELDAAVPISPANPTWGSRTALVTIVEFADFECPYCAKAASVMADLEATYGPDKLRVVWKNAPLPFHANALPAAEAGMGVFAMAGSEAFWKFHDLAFENQGALSRDSYVKWATQAGVRDGVAIATGLDVHRWASAVTRDTAEADALKVDGVPAFFVNGSILVGAQPVSAFKTVIDRELEKAHTLVLSGLAPDRIYARAAAENMAAYLAARAKEEEEEQEADAAVYRVPAVTAPIRGSSGALVTVIEFSDFQCPFCARVEPTIKALRDKYGDALRIVWKNEPLPFHPAAEPAAEAALEVRAEKGDAAFWDVHDRIFARRDDLVHGATVDVEALVRDAVEAGARADGVRNAIVKRTHAAEIEADVDLADQFSADGTPQFFINGRRLIGAQPEEAFVRVIDEELVRARAALAAGVKPADLYATLVKDGKGPADPEQRSVPASLPVDDPVRGDLKAKVTVHEWCDFQDESCARVEPSLVRLLSEYRGRVNLVWHDLPLQGHGDAPLAARAGRQALSQRGLAAFWSFHDALLGGTAGVDRAALDKWARANHLDLAAWHGALDAPTFGPTVASARAAEQAGFEGAPAFLIVPADAPSGYAIAGAPSYTKLHRIVERALVDAGQARSL